MSILPHGMRSTLKTNLNRTVLLERDRDSGIVIKRFHSPGAIRRLADGRRAVHEFRVLTELHERGLPVPAPLEVRKREQRWEVVIEWIPAANPLDEFLEGARELPPNCTDLARSLATLLARTWSAGLAHSDLHAGNVLLDEEGKLWLIDFQHARLRAEIPARRMQRDLVLLAAEVREQVSRRFRARFLVELLRQLTEEQREALGQRSTLSRRVEEEARLHHRYRVHRRQLRWTRESSSCRAFAQEPVFGWVNSEIDPTEELLLKDLITNEFDEHSHSLENGFERREIQGRDANWILIGAQEEAVLREAWYTAVRLQDHGLAAPTPCLFAEEPSPRILLRETPNKVRLSEALNRQDLSAKSALLRSVMRLLGSLHDRGLALANLSDDTFRVDGTEVSFGAPIELVASNPSKRARDRVVARELIGGGNIELTDAYCSAWRGDSSELAELAEEIARD